MNFIYLVDPHNPNLKHSSDSFMEGLKLNQANNIAIERLSCIDLSTSTHLIKSTITMPSSDTISAFFFSTQPEYILIIAILRCLSFILHKDLKIYHQMHEPRYEKGRASLKKSLLVYWANFIMSRLSDRIILSSKQALIKGETFIRKDKIALINLTFLNNNRDILARNIVSLKRSWEILKTISVFGIGARDKNLEGFLALANIINGEYPDRVQCIRAGWDKNIQLGYEKEKIIHFPGYITNSAKNFILSLTHIIVVPYQFSTQSGVVIEALSHGKIVVVNNISAFNHLKDLKSVFIVNFNDREQILSCVNKIFSMTPEEYEECYWESINYFNKNHSILYLKDNINKLII